jgi:hypothetical protein
LFAAQVHFKLPTSPLLPVTSVLDWDSDVSWQIVVWYVNVRLVPDMYMRLRRLKWLNMLNV